VWEWRHPDPVVEIRLLGERNFAIANFILFPVRLHTFRLNRADSANAPEPLPLVFDRSLMTRTKKDCGLRRIAERSLI